MRRGMRKKRRSKTMFLVLYDRGIIAYDTLGIDASWDDLLKVAAEECGNMKAALLAVSVDNEPNPAKINWNC